MADTMNARERWLAAMRLEPLDRLAFWPKLDGSYPRRQQGRWRDMSVGQIHEWIGSELHHCVPACVRVERTSTSVETERQDDCQQTTWRTPSGELRRVDRWDEGSSSWHPVEFPVKTAADVDIMRLTFEDARAETDPEQDQKARDYVSANAGQNMLVTSLGVSPLMDWVQHVAGIETAHYLLADERESVEALFDAMHRLLCDMAVVIADRSPADGVYSTENTSTTLISPDMFRRYNMRYLREYGETFEAAGKMQILHQCGYLKALLPDMATLPAGATEAFTSPPVGDTRLLDGRSACPDLCLIGGTNATLWLEPAERIIDEIEEDLDALPHTRGVIVSSAGVMPPFATPEIIKQVCDWVKSYPVR